MHDGSQYLDVILFAMVAIFLGLRLRSVLGRRTGNEKPPPGLGPVAPPSRSPRTIDVAPLSPVPAPAASYGPASAGLVAIARVDPSFSPDTFLAGARGAFEIIVGAFAKGDETVLRGLLADEVFQPFAQAIRDRKAEREVCDNQLERLDEAEFVEAGLDGSRARITVRFASRQTICTKDSSGTVIEGDDTHPVEVVDLWTFSRDLRSRDPNWLLTATSSPGE